MSESLKLVLSIHSEPERFAVIFYDIKTNRVIDDLTDYTIYLADVEQLNIKTIADHAYFLKRFYEYVHAGSAELDNCTDSVIEAEPAKLNTCTDSVIKAFRSHEKLAILRSKASKQNERIANGTVNERLRRVYHWLTWLQATGRVRESLIGIKGCGVRSFLPSRATALTKRHLSPAAARTQSRQDYPLLFRKTAAKSRHKRKFVPTEDFRFQLIQRLHETAVCPYLAHRNALIVDIANTVGFRRESINSLRMAQFLEGEIKTNNGGFMYVTPSKQKFGYEESFAFPLTLAQRIAHFISHYLLPTAKSRKWRVDLKTSPLILSYRNGLAMRDRSITKLLAVHFRALGAPAGSATHSLRHKFANDEIRDETEYRLQNNIDSSAQSIAATVSLRMGQSNPDSLEAYVSSSITAPRMAAAEDLKAHAASLEAELLALRSEVKNLRAQAGQRQP